MRALVVDDSPIWRLLGREVLLRDCGFEEVAEAADGLEALERLRSGAFDLVLTDVSMPRMGGLALLKALRGLEGLPPVLVLSSYRAEDMAGPAKALGAADYLVKGCPPAALARAVRRALGRPREAELGSATKL